MFVPNGGTRSRSTTHTCMHMECNITAVQIHPADKRLPKKITQPNANTSNKTSEARHEKIINYSY